MITDTATAAMVTNTPSSCVVTDQTSIFSQIQILCEVTPADDQMMTIIKVRYVACSAYVSRVQAS